MTQPRVIFVKLGGSLITDKSGHEVARPDVLARLASELRQVGEFFDGGIVLGHGSGSFGHAIATEAGWPAAPERPSLEAVARTQDAAARLHREVLAALLEAGLPSFSLAPGSFMVSSNGRIETVLVEPLLEAIRTGLLPVLKGDVVLDARSRATILSTEGVFLSVIPLLIARGFEVPSVYWLGNTDGILDPGGNTISRITRANAGSVVDSLTAGANLEAVTRKRVRDVTGGMRHRLESALALCRLGVPSWILNGALPGELQRAVAGDAVSGTCVDSIRLATD